MRRRQIGDPLLWRHVRVDDDHRRARTGSCFLSGCLERCDELCLGRKTCCQIYSRGLISFHPNYCILEGASAEVWAAGLIKPTEFFVFKRQPVKTQDLKFADDKCVALQSEPIQRQRKTEMMLSPFRGKAESFQKPSYHLPQILTLFCHSCKSHTRAGSESEGKRRWRKRSA